MFINLFYNTQDIHKMLIQSSYNDYKREKINFRTKYPIFTQNITIHDYNIFDEQTKKEWEMYNLKITKLQKNIINKLLDYSNNYPNEKISKDRFINEYKKYPYLLEQNLRDVLLDL